MCDFLSKSVFMSKNKGNINLFIFSKTKSQLCLTFMLIHTNVFFYIQNTLITNIYTVLILLTWNMRRRVEDRSVFSARLLLLLLVSLGV